jgi:hypothetical protein
MTAHPLVLADRHRLEAFAMLARPRSLQHQTHVWVDEDGTPWIAANGKSVAIGLTTLGAGWVWDTEARQQRKQEYEASLHILQQASPASNNKKLHEAIRRLRLGGHAERLLWAIHGAVRQSLTSLLHLPDVYLAEAVWGKRRDHSDWPPDWREVLRKILKDLTWLHVADSALTCPHFGAETILLTHVGDLKGDEDEDKCCDDCLGRGGADHHHFQVEIGPGFLGVLEEVAQLDEKSEVRTYPSLSDRKTSRKPLRKLGKTGRLVSLFLPAKLGSPAACNQLNVGQHRLLQALVRETIRATRKPKQMVSEAEVLAGNLVPDLAGRNNVACPLLKPEQSYVAFNGNGKRRGCGYLLLGEHGWLARAGYANDDVEVFLSDLASLSSMLSLTVVGVGKEGQWIGMDDLHALSRSGKGRNALSRLHLRVYASPAHLQSWSALFEWAAGDNGSSAPAPTEDGAEALASMLARRKLSVRQFAAAIGEDPSFLNKVLRGKPCPERLLTKAKAWDATAPLAVSEPSAMTLAAPNTITVTPKEMLAIALEYLHRGWSIVPQISGTKKPCVVWRQYQEVAPKERVLKTWWSEWPDAGPALVLGPVSGIFLVEVDGSEGHAELIRRLGGEPVAPKVISGSGKPDRYHLYFQCPDVPPRARQTPWHPQLEFRGQGGIIILPPSLHASGRRYAWVPGRSPDDLPLPPLPALVVQALTPPATAKKLLTHDGAVAKVPADITGRSSTMQFLAGRYSEGPRWNDRLFRAACDLCGRAVPQEVAEPLLLAGARPWTLGEEENARRTIQSAYSEPRVPGLY